MKVFICADVHGNVRALDVVLSVYRREFPCEFLFLGDCVGYGSHPDACLDRILNLPRAHLLMGNHEWALLNRGERVNLNVIAAEALNWSEAFMEGRFDRLIRERFLMEFECKDYLAAHASPSRSGEWPYIFTYIDADEVFYERDFRICFVGHTHIQSVFSFNGNERTIDEGSVFRLDPGDRYIINPGSVGQPRDLDTRASCCIFDSDEGTIKFLRCEYDIEAEVRDINEAGLPHYLGERLLRGV